MKVDVFAMHSVGIKVRNFKIRTEPVCYSIFFLSIIKDKLAVLQQRAVARKTAEIRIADDTLCNVFISLVSLFSVLNQYT
jgi:hypothetical protein